MLDVIYDKLRIAIGAVIKKTLRKATRREPSSDDRTACSAGGGHFVRLQWHILWTDFLPLTRTRVSEIVIITASFRS